MKYSFILLFLLAACSNQGNNNQGNSPEAGNASKKQVSPSRFVYKFSDTTLFAKIEDTLMKFSFVRKSDLYIDSFSNHAHGISFLPDTSGGKISVMAGYNGPERFETYYNFEIDPATFDIRVLDPLTGEFISVEDYIKRNKE